MAGDKTLAQVSATPLPATDATKADVKPPKKKFTRAFSHKVRTGCLTWIRRKKCDEAKPFCQRCTKEKVKCDGYANPVKKPSNTTATIAAPTKPAAGSELRSNKRHVTVQYPVQRELGLPTFLLSDIRHDSDREKYLFYHFRTWTCGTLTETPGVAQFWDTYVLPLAHHDELVRKAVTAVGAAHQLFVTRRARFDSDAVRQLEHVTNRQYNSAISALVQRIKVGMPVDTPVVLLSCLLFLCFEGMMGRYAEVLRHLKAGLGMLKDPNSLVGTRDKGAMKHVIEMFGQLSCETSIFMEEELYTDESHRTFLLEDFVNDEDEPFASLSHASLALKALDMEISVTCDTESPDPAISEAFAQWDRRFKLLVATLDTALLSEVERHQLLCLKLQQRLWCIFDKIDFDDCGVSPQPSTPEVVRDWTAYLDVAEEVAKRYISQGLPTFSLDGNLVSGLSLMISTCTDFSVRRRGVALLRSLNRREGCWDSDEIAEMHEATLALHDCDAWYNLQLPGGGVPAYCQVLSVVSTGISPGNALLSVPSSAMVASGLGSKAPSIRAASAPSNIEPMALPLR